MWYAKGKECFALRKHTMRADMRVYVGDGTTQIADMTGHINSILSAAIIKGLDVIGIVSPQSPAIGWQAQQMAAQNKIDLWVVPGEEYYCLDEISLVAFMLKEPLPPALDSRRAIAHIRRHNGVCMVFNLTKRQAQQINKYAKSDHGPHAVEIYNAMSGGFQDLEIDYPKFVNSAATSAAELEKSNVFTLMNRKELTRLGLLPEHYGEEYTPGYLQDIVDPADATEPEEMIP